MPVDHVTAVTVPIKDVYAFGLGHQPCHYEVCGVVGTGAYGRGVGYVRLTRPTVLPVVIGAFVDVVIKLGFGWSLLHYLGGRDLGLFGRTVRPYLGVMAYLYRK